MTVNRTPSDSRVKEYTRRILEGEWQLSDPIQFDTNNQLYDGQHRLLAVIKANQTTPFVVLRGLPPEAKQYCDIGFNRSALHIAQLQGKKVPMGFASKFFKIILSPESMNFPYTAMDKDRDR